MGQQIYRVYLAFIAAICTGVFSSFASAQIASGGPYSLEQAVIAGGGGQASGYNYDMDMTLAQALAGGDLAGSQYNVFIGFWHGFIGPTPTPTATPTATPTETPTNTPTATPTPANTPSISGIVTYGNAAAPPKYISNVTITGTGAPNVFTTTAAPGGTAGQYTLTGFGAGSYTVSLSKTTGQNSINSFDAARIAQHVAGTLLLTTNNQKVSADVTGNNAVSSQDAAKIAQVVTGLPFSPPNFTGQWRFFVPPGPTFPIGSSPMSRPYPSITGNLTGEDYIGLLIGEVTGNWVPSAARPINGSGPERSTAVAAPRLAAQADTEILIPIDIQGATDKGIISYEFDLRYDPAVIRPQADAADLTGTVSRGLTAVANPNEPGLLRVVVYGPLPIGRNGVLLNLRFTAVGAPGSISPLKWERIMLNEGDPAAITIDGQVELSTAASGAVGIK